MQNRRSTGFFEQVYEIVTQIPAGYVATYGQIAKLAGRPHAARIVGYAMHSAPSGEGLPCHRVVNRRGELAPGSVFGGGGVQRAMLEDEGIVFLADGRIDMKNHLWLKID